MEASKTVEQPKRDACKDGLAGVDINNAGVIVIDDRPDDQVDDFTENDFEEVLSKRNKRLRQQQINEQIEAVTFSIFFYQIICCSYMKSTSHCYSF